MSEEDDYKIKFPCSYPIKVMGIDENDFSTAVLEIIRKHAPGFTEEHISFRASSSSKYLSVKVTITATGIEQLEALHVDLKASGRVSMVL